ncbi:hypothetical protein C0Q70_04304 [Pomacea canaliculata]|uniref:Uncharacterized protein n=1 Tax=Pomacea canaliculata TaxID=400727 RepID=A0A2T7PV54_POMCA|nr:hypothetical protein C0Q70_04304 [Pomacea canaliculata]
MCVSVTTCTLSPDHCSGQRQGQTTTGQCPTADNLTHRWLDSFTARLAVGFTLAQAAAIHGE